MVPSVALQFIEFVPSIDAYAADIDNDGDNDVLYITTFAVYLSKNNGNGNFANSYDIGGSNPSIIHNVFSKDIDNDSNNDVLIAPKKAFPGQKILETGILAIGRFYPPVILE